MIFSQEAPLESGFHGGPASDGIGIFEEGGNRSARRKPSKLGWGRLKLNLHTAFVVKVEGVIDVHYVSLTSQGVQHGVFHLDGHRSRHQPCPTGLNFDEQTRTGDFPLVIAVPMTVLCARMASLHSVILGKKLIIRWQILDLNIQAFGSNVFRTLPRMWR